MIPKISVVCPIHNMEGKLQNLSTWITKCDNQFQIILVCDSSTDETAKELLQLQETLQRTNLRIVVGDFGSPGVARNIGADLAENEWIIFWDSDDLGDPSCLINSLGKYDSSKLDAVVFGYEVYSSGKRREGWREWPSEYDRCLDRISLNPGIWRFCFSRTSIGDLKFPSIRMAEDQLYINEFINNSPNLLFDNSVVYRYFMDVENQLTSNPIALKDIDLALKVLRTQMRVNPQNSSYTIRIYGRLLFTQLKRGHQFSKLISVCRIWSLIMDNPRATWRLIKDMRKKI
jgi:glycosyltransferase involved in cell wall biosynthesis